MEEKRGHGGAVLRRRQEQGKCSFLKKRTKKLLPIAAGIGSIAESGCQPQLAKVFWFLFSKKNPCLDCVVVQLRTILN
jgi:hypothetical protein